MRQSQWDIKNNKRFCLCVYYAQKGAAFALWIAHEIKDAVRLIYQGFLRFCVLNISLPLFYKTNIPKNPLANMTNTGWSFPSKATNTANAAAAIAKSLQPVTAPEPNDHVAKSIRLSTPIWSPCLR